MNLPDSRNKILKQYPEMSNLLPHFAGAKHRNKLSVRPRIIIFTQNQPNSCKATFTSMVAPSTRKGDKH